VKGNVVPGPGTLNGRAKQDNPCASQPDECFEMTLIVLALNHAGAEEVMKQCGCLGGVFYDEGYMANRFEHESPLSKFSFHLPGGSAVRQ
jgi:hypothetical protein